VESGYEEGCKRADREHPDVKGRILDGYHRAVVLYLFGEREVAVYLGRKENAQPQSDREAEKYDCQLEGERTAARQAVETLGLQPVMAEEFGAQPYSPQEACLEGVRTSDIYLGILGQRYGSLTKAGISVTEEEFNEAREQGKQIYLFVKKCERETSQEQFFERIQSYEAGYLLEFFDTPTQLAAQVSRSLHDYGGGLEAVQLGSAEASEVAARYASDIGPSRGTDTAVGAVLIPVQKREYLSLSTLSEQTRQDELLQPALFGSSAILDSSLRTERREKENSFAFQQSETPRRLMGYLEFYSDGSLTWFRLFPQDNGFHVSLVHRSVAEETYTKRLLENFFRYAEQYYNRLPGSSFLSQLYLTCVFYNMLAKWFGRIPEQEPNSMPMPVSHIDNPFLAPSEPVRISRSRLGQPTQLVADVTEKVARAFRVQERYYPREER